MSTALSVNLNKIALLRNSREGDFPSVLTHGKICLDAGADGLTVHPRPDQRHIRPQDVYQLAELVANHTGIEFNIEGNPFAQALGDYPGLLTLVEETRPHQCTLVPDADNQLTSDHGFDLTTSRDQLQPIIARLHQLGVRISLFMDPDPEQIRLAAALGVERIELYTGPYAQCFSVDNEQAEQQLARYRTAADIAQQCGLEINAGHDLNLKNLPTFLTIPNIAEVSIGHALTVDALNLGLANAVAAYRNICQHKTAAGIHLM
ncbi:pyridoxine 5'-phosphate synthase [Gilvimarinus polysaccharolyticus]|uniref:pyridoxine 5'-phosphate synthase n=1 Tax=Gilvimarinus polysaccharolyticus TaxID=863921 RepID=UPI0006730C4E|nr:pyridoxine 5'-phosphate synthase [Gilvimarinus polysaccharolyticus]